MTIENNTAQEIAEIHASLLDRYTKSGETIEGADLISEAAAQNVKNIIRDFLKVTTPLGSRNQIEMLGLIEKIIASSYLAALAEVIKEKQSYREKISTRQASYSANGAKDSRVKDIMVIHNSK